MGAHKHNPVAQAAKRGELPPKKRPMSKAQSDAWAYGMIYNRLGLGRIYEATNTHKYYTKEV